MQNERERLRETILSLLNLIKANRLVLGEHMGPDYIDKKIKKAEAVLKNDASV